MSLRPFRRLEIEIESAKTSEIVSMYSIFGEAFPFENPKLAQVLYAGSDPGPVVKDILTCHLNAEYNKFMIAYDTTKGLVPDPGFELEDTDEDPMAYGWISLGVVPHGPTVNPYAASDLSVYAALRLQAGEARDRGEDCVRLAHELRTRSEEGQSRYVADPHLVVNTLAMWPDSHSDSTWEMAFKLLGWAVEYAERRDWPIWTQIPVGQMRFFRQADFREVGAFTLNLNNYAPPGGTDFGTQEWVQMVYARSMSLEDAGDRRRNPSS